MDGAAVDSHRDTARRRAVEIVAAEDIGDRAAVDFYHHVTAGDIGLNIVGSTSEAASASTGAAIEAFIDSAVIEGHVGARTHMGQCTTAIDILVDGAVIDGHRSGTRDIGTVATASQPVDNTVGVLHNHRGITRDRSFRAAAEDLTLGEVGSDQSGIVAGLVVTDGHHRIGRNHGATTKATTKDIALNPVAVGMLDMLDVHRRRRGRGISGDILCQVATAIDVGEIEGTSTLKVLHIDSDVAGDIALGIRAAEGILNGTAIDIEGDVASDGSVDRCHIARIARIIHLPHTLRAGENVGKRTTLDVELHIASDGSHVAAAVDMTD